MALNDNSKDRIKFACKELEDAVAAFGAAEAILDGAVELGGAAGAKSQSADKKKDSAATSARQEKIVEIKRQLRDIREQLDSLSQ
jgi:hypothetical protein